MPSGARHGTLLAALIASLVVALPAAAAGRPPQLVAQIAQAQPTPTPGGEPELSDEPPTQLGGGNKKPKKTTKPASQQEKAGSGSLANTGSDAGMLALAGFALLGWGVALRLRVGDAT
jgi:hypothetical protein